MPPRRQSGACSLARARCAASYTAADANRDACRSGCCGCWRGRAAPAPHADRPLDCREMTGETVPQHVRMHACTPSPRAPRRARPAGWRCRACSGGYRRGSRAGRARPPQRGPADLNQQGAGLDRLAAHRHGALALALAGDRDQALGEIQPGIDIESGGFRNSQTGRIKSSNIAISRISSKFCGSGSSSAFACSGESTRGSVEGTWADGCRAPD